MAEIEPDKELNDLGKRIGKARHQAGLTPDNSADIPSGSGRGMQAGFELAIAVIACTFLGVGLDRWLETKPLFMLLGLAFGFAAGMWALYRSSLDT